MACTSACDIDPDAIRLFALDADRTLGESIALELGIPLAAHRETVFADGEVKTRAVDSVRGKDVFVIHSLHGDPGRSPDGKLMRLLFFLGALADAAPARVTAVVPYLCYARQDRIVEPNDPVATRYVARMFEAVGVDRLVAMDVHNLAAFQNAFRLPTSHVEAAPLFVAYFAAQFAEMDIVVVSPDAGGVHRAERFRQALSAALRRHVTSAFVEKQRTGSDLGGISVSGDFSNRTAIILDDMISTGATIVRAARICCDSGASYVYAAATHAVFSGDAARALTDPILEKIVVTDSISDRRPGIEPVETKLVVLHTGVLLADAIREIHADGQTRQPSPTH